MYCSLGRTSLCIALSLSPSASPGQALLVSWACSPQHSGHVSVGAAALAVGVATQGCDVVPPGLDEHAHDALDAIDQEVAAKLSGLLLDGDQLLAALTRSLRLGPCCWGVQLQREEDCAAEGPCAWNSVGC